MEESELASIVQERSEDAIGAQGDTITSERIDALKRYRGEPYGDEVEGRSKVVTHDVAEAVDSLMPPLLNVFMAGDKVVLFEPSGQEDVQAAEQATDYCNHIFLKSNNGFRLVYTTLKDGLLFKTGVAKVWWDDTPDISEQTYIGLSEEQVMDLDADESIEIEIEENPEYQPGMGINVTVKRTNTKGRCCVEAIPPEEFLIDRYATKIEQDSPDGPLFTAHRQLRIQSDVIDQFPDKKDEIEAAIGGDLDFTGERQERHSTESSVDLRAENDDATRPVWVTEAYIRVDFDGDGIAELRKVTCVGDTGYVVLDNEIVDDNCFSAWSPIMMPHKFHGMSAADQIIDLQRINTALHRGALNNLYFANEPMTKVSRKANVDLDQLLNRRIGGIVETDDMGGIEELMVTPMFQFTLPMIERIEEQKASRTGVTKYTQGLDADALNKTARGITIIQDAAQQRQQLIARVYAEMFMKRVFALILKNVSKYQTKPSMIRLRNEWVPMDPRTWKNKYDMTVTVGLGTGNRDQQAAHAMTVLNIQKEMKIGGMDDMVTDANIHATLAKFIEAIGWKTPDPYFTDTSQQPKQEKPPPVDPKVVEIQGKQQLQAQKDQMDHQYRMAQLEKDGATAMQKVQADAATAMYKAQVEAQIKGWEAEQEADRKDGIARSDSDRSLAKAIDEIDIHRMSVESGVDMKREMHETTKQHAAEKGESGRVKIVTGAGTELNGINDAFKDIANQMKESTDSMKAVVEKLSGPKQITLQRDAQGRAVGGTVRPA